MGTIPITKNTTEKMSADQYDYKMMILDPCVHVYSIYKLVYIFN